MVLSLNELSNEYIPTLYGTILFSNKNILHTLKLEILDLASPFSLDHLNLYFVDINNNNHTILINEYSITSNIITIKFYVDLPEGDYKSVLLINCKLNDKYVKQFINGVKTVILNKKQTDLTVLKTNTIPNEPNYLLNRFKANIPAWSSSFQKDVSNLSKLIEPNIKYINNCYSRLNSFIKNHRNDFKTV